MIKKISLLFICSSLVALCYGRPYDPGPGQTPPVDTGKNASNTPQTNTSQNKTNPPAATPPSAPPALPRIIDIKIFHSDSPDTDSTNTLPKNSGDTIYAGNIISFRISNAKAFLRSKPTDQAKVVLYANGIEMTGITSDWYSQAKTVAIQAGTVSLASDTATISIQLVRNQTSQSSWNFLYSNTACFIDTYFNVTHASIGWEHMSPLDNGGQDTPLTVAFYKKWEFIAWIVLYIIILGFFIWLASTTDVLKVTSKGPYSLSYTQLLFWTSLVMGAFIYTLLLTDISMSFNTSILGILGISLGTTGAATAIDQNKITRNVASTKVHRNFLKDILTDGDSFSAQRVQSFAWNLLFGLYFITYTIKNKTMPEFSNTMLLLAGFSTTSYLTGKLSENTSTTAAAQTAQAATATSNQPVKVQPPPAPPPPPANI